MEETEVKVIKPVKDKIHAKKQKDVEDALELDQFGISIVKKSVHDYRIIKVKFNLDGSRCELEELKKTDSKMAAIEEFKLHVARSGLIS